MHPSCSTQFAEIMLEGMQEVIGESDLQAFFQRSQYEQSRLRGAEDGPAGRLSFADLRDFQTAVEASFGVNGGRGVLLRSGRASFRHLLPAFWEQLGLTNLQYRLNPTPVRIRHGLKALGRVLAGLYDQEIEVSDEITFWKWRMAACPFCWQRETKGPVCDFAVGVLQEYLSWASSGRFYMVEEVECLGAGGSACTIHIMKKPLD